MSAQMVTIFSLEYFLLTLSVKTFPFAKPSSSILHTIIFGLMLSNPREVKNFFSNWSITENSEWSKRWRPSTVVFQDKLWVIGGYHSGWKNDAWSSVDGSNWIQESSQVWPSGGAETAAIAFDGKLWVNPRQLPLGGTHVKVAKYQWAFVQLVMCIVRCALRMGSEEEEEGDCGELGDDVVSVVVN